MDLCDKRVIWGYINELDYDLMYNLLILSILSFLLVYKKSTYFTTFKLHPHRPDEAD